MSEDNDDATGQTSGEDTQEMPTEQQRDEWERGDEESPVEESEDEKEEGSTEQQQARDQA